MYMKQGSPVFTLVKSHILLARAPTLVEAEVIFLIFAKLSCRDQRRL